MGPPSGARRFEWQRRLLIQKRVAVDVVHPLDKSCRHARLLPQDHRAQLELGREGTPLCCTVPARAAALPGPAAECPHTSDSDCSARPPSSLRCLRPTPAPTTRSLSDKKAATVVLALRLAILFTKEIATARGKRVPEGVLTAPSCPLRAVVPIPPYRADSRWPASHLLVSHAYGSGMDGTTHGCFTLPAHKARPSLHETKHRVCAGLKDIWHIPNWLNLDEAMALVEQIDSAPHSAWTQLRDRRMRHLGGSPVDTPGIGIDLEPLPSWAQAICDEMVRVGAFPASKPPNHVLLNEYAPGQGLDAHMDGPLYAPRVAVLSLGSHTTLEFLDSSHERKRVAALLLPPRGMLVFAGPAYTQYLHTIKRQAEDDTAQAGLTRCDLQGDETPQGERPRFLPRGRRLSLTVRRVQGWWEKGQ